MKNSTSDRRVSRLRAGGRRVRLLGLWMMAVLFASAGCQRHDVDLEIQPSRTTACDLPISVMVSWDVSRSGLEGAYIEINSPGSKPKLWMVDEIKGSRETGKWVQDGFTATLKSMDGRVLTRRSFTTDRCPGKDWL